MKLTTQAKNIILSPFNLLYKINPALTLKIIFKLKQGYKLDLNNPQTFNEKLQWLKLNDKNKLKITCTDKYTVRNYVKSKGLKSILNELLWEGFDPELIPFDKLPSKFVIKVTHGSTFNIICSDKDKLDVNKTVKQLKKWLKSSFIPCYGEWYYGIQKPRIIIEKFIDSPHGLKDYKIYCFNGKPKLIGVFSDRYKKTMYQEMYNCSWKEEYGKTSKCPNPIKLTPKPLNLSKMIEYARILSKDFIHVRVDFFYENDKIIFGELTFADGSGFDKFSSYEYDKEMGDYLKL